MPLIKNPGFMVSMPGQCCTDHRRGSYALLGFGIKEVGISDDFFFDRFWLHLPQWQRQVLGGDVFNTQPDTNMSFANQRVARQPFLAKDFSTDYAMGDIGPIAVSFQFRGVGKQHADIMQQRCLFDEILVDLLDCLDSPDDPECKLGNPLAVCHQDALCPVVSRVILID